MQKRCDLSIIILNFNTREWVKNVLDSIQRFPLVSHTFEVIVVDNASTDDSVEMIKEHFPTVKVVESQENGGFAKGNNQGIAIAKGRYLMLLNSDAEWTEKTKLDEAVLYLDAHTEVGMLSPKLVLPDGSIDLASHRGEPTPWAAFTYFCGFEKLIPNSKLFGQYHQTWKNFSTPHSIDACSGAAMIIREEVIENVGTLDENFFMYAEDLDWCKRIREGGYQIVFFPQAEIIHHKYKSGQAKETAVDPQQFLRIPGFSQKTRHSGARHHFFETMKQYYTKHYQKSSPIQTWMVHKMVDIVKWWKMR